MTDDGSEFGPAVRRLAATWSARNTETGAVHDHEARKAVYPQERKVSYDRICAAYVAVGMTPPKLTVLLGDP